MGFTAFPFLTLFMILIIFIYIRTRNAKTEDMMKRELLDREIAANAVRAVDLDTLEYLTIPLDRFPIGKHTSDDIKELENTITELSKKRILNLTGLSNTELKEQYGPKNLPDLQEYGDNFDQLVLTVKDYGQALVAADDITSAIEVLEYGVGIGTDIRANYITLAECYLKEDMPDKVGNLIDILSKAEFMLAPNVKASLEDLLHQTQQ